MIDEYCNYLRGAGYAEATADTAMYTLRRYSAYIGDNFNKRIDSAAREDIEKFYDHLKKRISRRTIITTINVIRGFYKHISGEGLILINPVEEIDFLEKVDRLPKHVPDEDTVRYFLTLPDGYTYPGIRDKAMLEVLYSTGIRRKEMIKLLVTDIDLTDRVLKVREGKGGRDRIVPAGKEACKWVERYMEVSRPKYLRTPEEDHLFITERGEGLKDHTVNELFRRHRNKSRLTAKITPHSLRHACALHMLRGGAKIEMVQRMLGHKRISSTQIYTRLCPKDLIEAHRKCHPRERQNIKS